MPAYGNALNPAETTALVHFLLTLRGGNLTPAIDASRQMVQSSEQQPPPSRPTTPGER
jgi:ubiquinol-cytochrome c reductase cytochrome b subunit